MQAPFLAASAALSAVLGFVGQKKSASLPVFALGGAALWYCLLAAGVNADIAGVITGLCVSTQAECVNAEGQQESFAERCAHCPPPRTDTPNPRWPRRTASHCLPPLPTDAQRYPPSPTGDPPATHRYDPRMIAWLSPLSCFFIMPMFALANTAVKLGGGAAAGSIAPAAGIGAGLLLGAS